MKVMWKPGYNPAGVDAKTAYDTINELCDKGKSTAKDLVDASRPDDAPLHRLFEWDDSVAAEKYRESQARTIIAHLVLIREEDEHPAQATRAFFAIDPTPSRPYEPTVVIMGNQDKKERLLEIAKRELESFKTKYRMLHELDAVFDAIDKVIQD